MARRRQAQEPRKAHFDWGIWVRSFGIAILGFAAVMVTFYFTTKFTLDKHEEQFKEVGRKFDGFQGTLKQNYEDWAKTQQAERAEREKIRGEERAEREKVRDSLMALFTGLSTSSADTRARVEGLGKQLDSVQNKIEGISSRQQEERRR